MENQVCKSLRNLGMTILVSGCFFGVFSLMQGVTNEEGLKILIAIISIISSITAWIFCAWLCEMLENSIKQTENTTNLLAKINTLTNLIEKQK